MTGGTKSFHRHGAESRDGLKEEATAGARVNQRSKVPTAALSWQDRILSCARLCIASESAQDGCGIRPACSDPDLWADRYKKSVPLRASTDRCISAKRTLH